MATFNQNGIQFTAIKGELKPAGKISKSINGDFADAGTDGVEPFVNAVEIDWNNAQLGSKVSAFESAGVQEGLAVNTINTTGELLTVIAQQQAQINALTLLVKGLYVGLAETE